MKSRKEVIMKIKHFFYPLIVLLLICTCESEEKGNGESTAYIIEEVQLIYQYKDTNANCVPGGNDTSIHPWNHAATGCPHCSTYCVPASIAMIAKAYGKTLEFIEQDSIYEMATEGGVDDIITTHGRGVFDGSNLSTDETLPALIWAVGIPFASNPGDHPTLQDDLKNFYIGLDRPVLWCDHNGWPDDQNETYPSSENRSYQGHAKVLGGYDDMGTTDPGDDLCLVFDPWPTYTDDTIVPAGALKGPGGSYDPYWLPVSSVVGDPNDKFYASETSIGS
jgi:hypothetical protein